MLKLIILWLLKLNKLLDIKYLLLYNMSIKFSAEKFYEKVSYV